MSKIIKLEKNILESAKIIACKINDKDTRLRTYALNIAASAAAQCLDELGLETDTKLSLYKISSFDRNFELADIYVNGLRFDVRITFDGKTFTIPKIHEKYDAVPLAYIVVKLDKNLEEAEIKGFVEPKEITFEKTDSPYYVLSTNILKPIENIKELAELSEPVIPAYSAQEHEKIKELSTAFIDDEISESEKVFFIKHVIACPVCRESYCDVNDFDIIVSQLKNYHELLNDSTLSVLSGNKKEVDEAVMANMALVENAQETAEPDEILSDEQTLGILAESSEVPAEVPDLQDLQEPEILTDEPETPEEQEEEKQQEETSQTEPETAEEETEELLLTETADTELTQDVEETLLEVSDSDDAISEIEENTEPLEKISENLDSLSSEEPLAELFEEDMILEEHKLEEEDSLSPIEPEDLETLDAIDDIIPLEEQPEQAEIQEPAYKPQEPVELNYDEEEAELIETPIIDITEQQEEEPQNEEVINEEVLENIEENTLNKEENTDDLQEESAKDAASDENEEIQSLLDDDLMALLSENDESPSEDTSADKTIAEENITEQAEVLEPEYQENEDVYEDSQKNHNEPSSNDEETPHESDETISTLFENDEQSDSNCTEKEFELAEEPVSAETINKTKRLAVMTGLLIVLLAAGGGMLFMNHQKAANDNSIDTSNQGDQLFDFQNKGSQEDTDSEPAISQDINRSMTNSFSDKPAAITVTKLSWQISEKLAAENSVKEYLQTAGKNIQMNLQNDLANSADVAFNNTVKVSFTIAPDNTMKGMQVLESSGSDKIDEAILRSIKNTLKYVSVPKLKDYKSDYFLTLIINF